MALFSVGPVMHFAIFRLRDTKDRVKFLKKTAILGFALDGFKREF